MKKKKKKKIGKKENHRIWLYPGKSESKLFTIDDDNDNDNNNGHGRHRDRRPADCMPLFHFCSTIKTHAGKLLFRRDIPFGCVLSMAVCGKYVDVLFVVVVFLSVYLFISTIYRNGMWHVYEFLW